MSTARSKTRVSFLIPVLDEEQRLAACLDSVLSQSWEDFEVLVVDDGSRDASREVAESFARQDRRLRVLESPREPGQKPDLPRALNHGLAFCRSEFVARLDADDRAVSDRLLWQLARLGQDRDLVVVDGQVRFTGPDGRDPGEGMRLYGQWVNTILDPGDFDRAILQESPVVHPAATFRRQAVLDVGGYRSGAFPEDYDLWVRLHLAGARFAKIARVCVEMLDHEDRLTRRHPAYRREAFRVVAQHWIEQRLIRPGVRFVLWGGPNRARPWLRWLRRQGHPPVAFVDIDPGRIGRRKGGDIPIIAPEDLARTSADYLLVAIQQRGAMEQIRQALRGIRPDWVEGRDWWALVC